MASTEPRSFTEKSRVLLSLNVVVVLTIATLAWLGWVTFSSHRYLNVADRQIDRIEQLRADIRYCDEALTMSAQMSAVTGDTNWELRYDKLDAELSAALEELKSLVPDIAASQAALATEAANNKLVGMERMAFSLVHEGKSKEAEALLSSGDYSAQKTAFASGMFGLGRELDMLANNELTRQHINLEWSLVVVSTLTPLLILAWWLMVAAAHRWEETIEMRNETLAKTNAELQTAIELANEANRSKSKFLSQMSHELRTPMNAILGFGQFLEDTDLGDDQRRDLDHILASSRHLVGLVDRLLEASEDAA